MIDSKGIVKGDFFTAIGILQTIEVLDIKLRTNEKGVIIEPHITDLRVRIVRNNFPGNHDLPVEPNHIYLLDPTLYERKKPLSNNQLSIL